MLKIVLAIIKFYKPKLDLIVVFSLNEFSLYLILHR